MGSAKTGAEDLAAACCGEFGPQFHTGVLFCSSHRYGCAGGLRMTAVPIGFDIFCDGLETFTGFQRKD